MNPIDLQTTVMIQTQTMRIPQGPSAPTVQKILDGGWKVWGTCSANSPQRIKTGGLYKSFKIIILLETRLVLWDSFDNIYVF